MATAYPQWLLSPPNLQSKSGATSPNFGLSFFEPKFTPSFFPFLGDEESFGNNGK